MQLQPEAPATLHIGEEDTTSYFYRAVRAGNQTFVATPADPGPDRCISCVTAHYFVTVIE